MVGKGYLGEVERVTLLSKNGIVPKRDLCQEVSSGSR